MSNIDPTQPEQGQATTQSVRDNFSAAATEIDSLAVDINLLLPGGIFAFNAYLDGYQDDGFHERFSGDLDTLVDINAGYVFTVSDTTNFPPDLTQWGQLTCNSHSMSQGYNMQTVVGYVASVDLYKTWQRYQIAGTWGIWVLVVDGVVQTMLRTGTRLDITNVPT